MVDECDNSAAPSSREDCEVLMELLSAPSREDAARWIREVGILDTLEARVLLSTANPGRRLRSLLEVAEFLAPVPADQSSVSLTEAGVHFIDPRLLSEWTRNTIGDTELADRIDRTIATAGSYSFLAPELQRLILARVSQYWELLRPEAAG